MSASRPCRPRRLLRQLQEGGGWLTLRSDKGEDIIAVARPTDDTLTQWKVAMRGPELSDMLRNEMFTLEVVLPDYFPMNPPKVRIVNEHLIHPNIAYKTGVVNSVSLGARRIIASAIADARLDSPAALRLRASAARSVHACE